LQQEGISINVHKGLKPRRILSVPLDKFVSVQKESGTNITIQVWIAPRALDSLWPLDSDPCVGHIIRNTTCSAVTHADTC
jgi:hypothetical protein